ncbi:Gfo/Idh/MocA family oxidoreductase, partial [bacterium]|nr:Gfo/Idh/MocA family oxidoreductase [bacterium]
MRTALLGFGKVAESTHLPGFAHASFQGRFSVVAVAEPSPERRARAKEALPGARVYESPESLLEQERELDLACVAAPPFLHAPLTLASLRAGLHVLCEKPLSLDASSLGEIEREARERRRVVYTVNNWRHAPLVDAALGVARGGKLGRLRLVVWSVKRKAADPGAASFGKTWREDTAQALGGVLVDHGWHALTVIHALLGSGPRTVRARLRDEPGKGDVFARVEVEQGGVRVLVRLTWRASRRSNRGLFLGDEGSVRLEDDRLVGPGRATASFPEKLSQGSVHPDWFPPVLRSLEDEVTGRAAFGRSLDEARYCAS